MGVQNSAGQEIPKHRWVLFLPDNAQFSDSREHLSANTLQGPSERRRPERTLAWRTVQGWLATWIADHDEADATQRELRRSASVRHSMSTGTWHHQCIVSIGVFEAADGQATPYACFSRCRYGGRALVAYLLRFLKCAVDGRPTHLKLGLKLPHREVLLGFEASDRHLLVVGEDRLAPKANALLLCK